MKDFNLKEALAGAKVITVGSDEVTDLTMMTVLNSNKLVGVCRDEVLQWDTFGVSVKDRSHVSLDLKMAPEMGSGFLYVFDDGDIALEDKKCHALSNPIMCFDLSEYPVGFGL
tara:strand:- start:81 stop:419 length:339 start_codon:yes stop_codon:yes gene_type:complete